MTGPAHGATHGDEGERGMMERNLHACTGDRRAMDDAALESLRIDKWLWAARFFKTRSLAAQAVAGGLVRISDQRVKASRRVRRGETIQVRRGPQAWIVVVRGLRDERRPAPEAQTLYEESAESIERRTSEQARREQAEVRRARAQGRPTKRERRALERWREDRSERPAAGERSDRDGAASLPPALPRP